MVSRLKGFISQSGLTTRQFAIKCGLPVNTLTNQLNGVRELSLKTVQRVGAAFPDLSLDWLISGEGDMLKTGKTLDFDRVKTLVDTIATLQSVISDKDAIIKTLLDQINQLKNTNAK